MTVRATRRTVTAIVPTHNRRTTLQATLTSVLDQRDVDLQVIVIDDGSTDDTGVWLASLDDPRVRVLRHDVPQGAAQARSTGVAAAETEYVAFCDDDDLWSPRKLAAQLDAVAASSGAGWSCTAAVSFVADRSTPVEIVHHQPSPSADGVLAGLLTSNIVPGGGSSVLVARDLMQEVGGFRRGLAEDWDLWIRLALASPMATVEAPLTGYRIWRGAGKSRSSDLRGMTDATQTVRERYRSEAETLGVSQVGHADDVYLAKIALRADLRIESVRALRPTVPSRTREAGLGGRGTRLAVRRRPGHRSPVGPGRSRRATRRGTRVAGAAPRRAGAHHEWAPPRRLSRSAEVGSVAVEPLPYRVPTRGVAVRWHFGPPRGKRYYQSERSNTLRVQLRDDSDEQEIEATPVGPRRAGLMGAHSVVTVTIPSYNYARYLRECVESAVHQEGVEVDVVIVENASTDGSRELARRLRDEHPNVRLVEHAENHGIICSLNRCRDEIRGDYVVLLCADDCLTPGSLARSVAFMDAHPNVGMTYGPVIDFTHVSDVKPAQLAAAPGPAKIYPGAEWIDRVCRARENPIRTPEVLMRVSTLAVAGRLDPACPHTSDLNMWLRMASYADVAFLPGQILAMYRQHETNHSNAYEGSALSTIEQKWVAFSAFLDTVADRPERARWDTTVRRTLAPRGPLLGVAACT